MRTIIKFILAFMLLSLLNDHSETGEMPTEENNNL